MPRGVNEANSVCGVGQELLAAVSRLEDPPASLVAEIDLDAAAFGDQTNQPFGHMRVELVDDEDPAGVRVGVDRRFDMSNEIGFGPRRANRCLSDAPVGDIPVGHQAQRAMARVLKLDLLVQPRAWRKRGMLSLERLDASLLVAADDMRALRFELRGLLVSVANRLNIPSVLLWGLFLIRRGQPVSALVRSDFGFFLKSDPPAGPICFLRCLA